MSYQINLHVRIDMHVQVATASDSCEKAYPRSGIIPLSLYEGHVFLVYLFSPEL